MSKSPVAAFVSRKGMFRYTRRSVIAILAAAIGLLPTASLWADEATTGFKTPSTPELKKTLDSHFQRGLTLRKEGKWPQAAIAFEKAAALAPKVFGPDHLSTALIWNASGVAWSNAREPKKAIAAYEESLRIRETVLGKDHELVGQTLNNLSIAHRRLGHREAAERLALRSLQIVEARLGPDHLRVADGLNNLAVLHKEAARYEKAESLFLRALEIRERRALKDDPGLAPLLNNLGDLYYFTGRFRDAEVVHLRALKLEERGEDHAGLELPLNHLALTYQALGRYREAEKLFLRALRLREKRADQLGQAVIFNNLGRLYVTMERFAEAEDYLRRSLAIREKKLGEDHLDYASALTNLGSLCLSLGRDKEADLLFRKAIEIREKNLGPDHPLAAQALASLAVSLTARGRDAEAEPLLLRALKIQQIKGGAGSDTLATNLAMCYRAQGRLKEAQNLLEDALQAAEKRLGAEHPRLVLILNNLATLHITAGRFPDADKLLQRGLAIARKEPGDFALAHAYQALARLNSAEGRLGDALDFQNKCLLSCELAIQNVFAFSSEGAMHAFLERTNLTLPGLISLAAATPDKDACSLALDWTLRRKGIIFDTVRRFRQLQDSLSAEDPLGKRLAEYRALRQRMADAVFNPAPDSGGEATKSELARWRKEADELDAELNRGLAARSSASAIEAVSTEKVRKILAPKSCLVEFVRCPSRVVKSGDWTAPHYFAFTLRPGAAQPELVDLGPASTIDKSLTNLRNHFADFQEKLKDCESAEEVHDLEKTQEKGIRKIGQAVHAIIFAPLQKALGDAELVYVAPDGELNRLPFEVLVDESGKYLVERYRFAYLSSGRDLLRPDAKPAKGTTVFANPDFKLDAPNEPSVAPSYRTRRNEGDRRDSLGEVRGGVEAAGAAAEDARSQVPAGRGSTTRFAFSGR
ncbi:MAG: tetratricopeptide repeat protein [Gemmataceae bacterium]